MYLVTWVLSLLCFSATRFSLGEICATKVFVDAAGHSEVQLFYVEQGDIIESAALQFCAKHQLGETECQRIQSYHQKECFDTVMRQQEMGNFYHIPSPFKL